MFLKFFIPFLFYLIRVRCDHIPEPQFEVVSPNYLIAKVPPFDADLIVFRLGLQRQGQNEEVMEFGGDRTIVINSPNLNLMKGDVINYLVAFRDDKNAYSASSGTFVFDGGQFRLYFYHKYVGCWAYYRVLKSGYGEKLRFYYISEKVGF